MNDMTCQLCVAGLSVKSTYTLLRKKDHFALNSFLKIFDCGKKHVT